jgi:4-hydroxy-tetrahydrodipicolinate reductase
MPKLAIIGFGKMGRVVEQLAPERGFEVVRRVDPVSGDARAVTADALAGADVAIEFSTPAAAPANVRACLEARCPVVVGTTGWYDQRPAIEAYARGHKGALLVASNFSVGVAAFLAIAQAAARQLRTTGFEAHIIETHHSAKKDAPSGTASSLEQAVRETWGREVPITSVRVGSVPGTHELIFDGPFEQIRVEHVARDRRVFADGALRAAAWIIGKTGVFTMNDVLGGQ